MACLLDKQRLSEQKDLVRGQLGHRYKQLLLPLEEIFTFIQINVSYGFMTTA